jgi:aminoglycoside phosphotransferase (APT) family kinase protein
MAPFNDSEIKARLLEYLARAFDCPGMDYAVGPDRILGGRDAAIFGFALEPTLPRLSGPLILRLARAQTNPSRVRLEGVIQNTLAGTGYPVPSVVAVESDITVLGGSFMIMTRLAGRPLAQEIEGIGRGASFIAQVQRLVSLPAIVGGITDTWVEMQIRLHELPPEILLGALAEAGIREDAITLDGQLMRLKSVVEECNLTGLRPGISWLLLHRPQAPLRAAICHGDFHPLNILAEQGRVTGIIDWANVVIASPEMDVGSAIANISTVPFDVPPFLAIPVRGILRLILQRYYRTYRRRSALDAVAVRYFQIFRAIAQLVSVGQNMAAGRSEGGAFQSDAGIRNLIKLVRRLSGVELQLAGFGRPRL